MALPGKNGGLTRTGSRADRGFDLPAFGHPWVEFPLGMSGSVDCRRRLLFDGLAGPPVSRRMMAGTSLCPTVEERHAVRRCANSREMIRVSRSPEVDSLKFLKGRRLTLLKMLSSPVLTTMCGVKPTSRKYECP
jgi:hypothetical protein